MTYFNVFLRILRLGEKCAYFTVFYNGFERTEQLWLVMDWRNSLRRMVTILFLGAVYKFYINLYSPTSKARKETYNI